MGAWLFFIYRVFMADETILKEIKNVVNNFGWDVNLMNGFWVKLNTIGTPKKIINFPNSPLLFCSKVTLPSIDIEYEDVSISVNKFRTPVPMTKVKSDLIIEVMGGTKEYMSNIARMYEIAGVNTNGRDVASLYNIAVWAHTGNYENIGTMNYKQCYIKSIGEISYEHGENNVFFTCPYTFKVGIIEEKTN